MCIEYDGEQHFNEYGKDFFNAENLEIRKLRDSIKNDYCQKNNIQLIRISYKENINEKLKSLIK